MKIAYVLTRFPALTATFVVNEMYWLRGHDIQLRIFSLYDPLPEPVHERARELLPYASYSPLVSWPVLAAHGYFLRRSPGRYLRALASSIRYTYREPKMLLRALSIFPKSVYFARQAEALGIEHIHAHFVTLGSVAATIVADLLELPLTIHPHAVGLFSRNQHAVRLQLDRATRIVTISSYHRDYIARLCPDRKRDEIEIVYCGVETEQFGRRAAEPEAGRPIQILSVGRLVEKKGHRYLVAACALLAQRGLDFQCRIVGTGPELGALEALIEENDLSDRVVLLGACSHEQVLELCQTSDVFALACVRARDGDQDGLPVSLMEAMACELPVVTTPIAGIPDLVQDGETGLLVGDRDAATLADALAGLMMDPVLRRRLGRQGRQKIEETFEIHGNISRLAAIFRQVVQDHRQTVSTEGSGRGRDRPAPGLSSDQQD